MLNRRYRNRRIGEFLKELDFTEGRGTGIPKMQQALQRNGSDQATFYTDQNRVFFYTEIQIHPEFKLKHETLSKNQHEVQGGVQGGKQNDVDISEMAIKILHLVEHKHLNMKEILYELGYQSRNRNVRNALNQLKDKDFVGYTIPEVPRNMHQKYKITALGKNYLDRYKTK